MPRRNHVRESHVSPTGPTVLAILDGGAMANARIIRAKVQYPGEAPQVVEFQGTPYGDPGGVWVLWQGTATRVVDPGRFGRKFGPGWVRRYWA